MAYTKPRPNVDFDIEPFWNGLREHRFLLQRCQTCGAWYWPAAYCRNHSNQPFMSEMSWELATGKGTVFTFNIHRQVFDPSFRNDTPYVFALIELDEGPMFGTNIIGCELEEVRIGSPVEIVFEDYPNEGFTLPKARLIQA